LLGQRALRLGSSVVSATYAGIGLALLDRPAVLALHRTYFDEQQQYARDTYNLQGLTGWEVAAIEQFFGECRSLLLAGAGGGREALALERKGYAVVGFDCNAKLVTYAQSFLARHGASATMSFAPPDRCLQTTQRFDGAVIGWGAYTHIQGRETRVRFLREIRECLANGAPLMLSFWDRSGTSRALSWTHRIGSTLSRSLRRGEVELGDELSEFFAHSFTRQEIDSELAEAGLRLLHYAATPYGHAVARAQ
jgi:SAM-dependent methyltransferase